MSGRYDPDRFASRYAGLKAPRQQEGVKTPKKADDDGDMWRFISDIAPAAGTALGGVAGGAIGAFGGAAAAGLPTMGAAAIPGAIAGGISGAGLGASLGGALGNGVSGLAKGAADAATEPYDEENERIASENDAKEKRRSEMLSILTSLRR